MGKTLPKPIRKCTQCRVIYVDDDLYRGTCPVCGAKQTGGRGRDVGGEGTLNPQGGG